VRQLQATATTRPLSDQSTLLQGLASSSRPYPLQVDTSALSPRSSVSNISPSPTLLDGMTSNTGASTRRSSESSRTMPIRALNGPQRNRSVQDRSMSMSAASSAARPHIDSHRPPRPPIPPNFEDRHSPNSVRLPLSRRTPIVYPALLSRVAEAFRDRITTSDKLKDGLTYKDAFDGREAVDKIAYIIKTTDRNLALLLGRALDAQKFFHDVTYDHRLRDSATELYQFRTKLHSPFVSGELPTNEEDVEGEVNVERKDSVRPTRKQSVTDTSLPPNWTPTSVFPPDSEKPDKDDTSPLSPPTTRPRKGSITSDEIPLPSGVFTLLTDCYSPTCSRDQLCYSIACPRRLEQQARLNMKPQPGLTKQISRESLGDIVVCPLCCFFNCRACL
jgi:RHO1 GDP-GTP exchange protein 1/2